MTEPRMPSRVRLARPALWTDEITGSLRPDARDAYLGIATIADDQGWILWRPRAIAALIYPYTSPARRERDFARRASDLVDAGLLELKPCGCATLPRMVRDLAAKGGQRSMVVETHHRLLHVTPDSDVDLRSDTSRDSSSSSSSPSSSLEGSSSASESGTGLGSVLDPPRARGLDSPDLVPVSAAATTSFEGRTNGRGRELDDRDRAWVNRIADEEVREHVRYAIEHGQPLPDYVVTTDTIRRSVEVSIAR